MTLSLHVSCTTWEPESVEPLLLLRSVRYQALFLFPRCACTVSFENT